MTNFKLLLPLLGLLPIAGTVLAQSPPHYTVTDLGSLGGQECAATTINNQGQIVGYGKLNGHACAFLLTPTK